MQLKGLWQASAHVRQLHLCSGERFFKIGVCWRNPLPSTLRHPRKSYLVHLGSFKRHILYFCASIVEKIRSHWGEPYEAKFVVVSVPTNGSNVAFNVVIWLSFLSIKVLQSTIYLWRIFFKRWICKESSRGFPRFSRGLLMARSGEWSLACEQALHIWRSREFTRSLRASSPIWASEASLVTTRERGAEERRACNDLL